MKVLMARQSWVFDQNVIWTADGRNVLVETMPERYRQNVVNWLERQAEWVAMNYATYTMLRCFPDMDPSDGKLSFFFDLERQCVDWVVNPRAWLHETYLVRRLKDPSLSEVRGLIWQQALPNPEEDNALLAMLAIKLRAAARKAQGEAS